MKLTALGKLLLFAVGLALVGTAIYKFGPHDLRERLHAYRKDAIATANRKPQDTRTTEPVRREEEPRTAASDGWVEIPAGAYLSGSERSTTTLAAFRIQKTEVTNAAYARFLEECPVGDICGPRDLPSYWDDPAYLARAADLPVVFVSWSDATAYCRWTKARLPSAKEWEKAARGADDRPFPSGAAIDPEAVNILGAENRERKADAPRQIPAWAVSDPRYALDRSPFGVLALSGNASEWTATAATEEPGLRYAAGGSWDSWDLSDAKVYHRLPKDPSDRSSSLGFRCAADVR